MKLQGNVGLMMLLAALSGLLVAERVRQPGGSEARLGAPFQVEHEETVRIAGSNLAITFDKVEEDSRCPKGAECVWAGRAVVSLTLSGSGQRRTLKLTLQPGMSEAASTQSGSYSVHISDLSPHPQADRQIDPSQYVATLLISSADPQGATL